MAPLLGCLLTSAGCGSVRMRVLILPVQFCGVQSESKVDGFERVIMVTGGAGFMYVNCARCLAGTECYCVVHVV